MSFQALLFCQDEKTARTVTQVLSELDFQVEACSETFAAVKKLTSQTFEAVVVDCQNEENAGLLLKTARNSASNQSALMVAVVEGQTGVAAAFRIGANLVLTKPIAVEQARGTLRVARGLLRKNTAPPASGTQVSSAPGPAAAPTSSLSATASALASTSIPAPSAARIPAASAPTLPKQAAPLATARPMPPIPQPLPVQPTASLTPGAFGKLESENELQPTPDTASAGLLEALDFSKKIESSDVLPFVGIATGAPSPVPFAKPTPIAVKTLGGSFGAAAAPAMEVAPAATVTDMTAPFETVAHTTAEPALAPAEAATEDEAPLPAPAPQTSKTPLIAIAVLLVAAAGAYWGWSQTKSRPAAATMPMTAPQGTNFPPTFDDPATTASQTPASAPKDAPPAVPAQTATPESANRFVHSAAPVAPDSVTPTRVPTPVPTPVHTATPTHSAPLQVKTQLQRVQNSTAARQDVAPEAPTIAGLGSAANALSAIAAPTKALPTVAPESHRISQGVSDGLLIKRVQPTYPAQALQMHIEGTVVLQATIARDGTIKNVKALSGPPILARAASDAVRQWKYRPYTLNGQPVEIDTQVSVAFKAPR